MEQLDVKRQQVIPRSTHEIHVLLKSYQLYARTEGKSPRTVRITASTAMLFRDFLYQAGLTTDAGKLGVLEIREFILYLQQVPAYESHPYIRSRRQPLAAHTVNTYLRTLRAFWSWLVREGLLPRNPFFDLRLPRAPHKVIPTFGEEQLRRLFRVVPTTTPEGVRDHAMMLLMLDTGIRLSELLHLKTGDLILDEGMLRVLGKGAKERLIPIGIKVQRAILGYLRDCRPEPAFARYDFVFLRRSGTPLDAARVEQIVRGYGRAAKLEGVRCSPHTFRHTFAISYLRNGGDVFSLQAILGHAGLEIVKHYVNLARSDIKTAHQKFSPADTLNLSPRGRFSQPGP